MGGVRRWGKELDFTEAGITVGGGGEAENEHGWRHIMWQIQKGKQRKVSSVPQAWDCFGTLLLSGPIKAPGERPAIPSPATLRITTTDLSGPYL